MRNQFPKLLSSSSSSGSITIEKIITESESGGSNDKIEQLRITTSHCSRAHLILHSELSSITFCSGCHSFPICTIRSDNKRGMRRRRRMRSSSIICSSVLSTLLFCQISFYYIFSRSRAEQGRKSRLLFKSQLHERVQ
jgi:hypothetical protein